jgi:flagellar hook-associated protein 1
VSLSAAFNIGRSALTASQLAVQVAGNNMANAATPGYSRQIARLAPVRGGNSISGLSPGSGVMVTGVQRQLDAAVEARLRAATADTAFANTRSSILSQVEDTLGELGENDLSSNLSAFFRTWSERANQTRSSTSVVQQGEQLAGFIRRLRSDLTAQRRQIDDQLGAGVGRANQLLRSIADLNGQVAQAEVGENPANAIRDQRDQAIRELSELMDVSVVDRGREGVDVLAGSVPVVLGATARSLTIRRDTENGATQVSIAIAQDNTRLSVTSGSMGGLLSQRTAAIDSVVSRLDSLSSQMIFEVNRLHSTGATAAGLRTTGGTLAIAAGDRTRAINDASNVSFAALPFRAVNGGFEVHVRHDASATAQTVRINVDLDGITNAGAPGTGDDTTAEQIRAALAAVPGLSASFTSDGRLVVEAAEGYTFNFANDTSGVLAVMGVNSYFTGTSASDIAVRSDLVTNSENLCAGRLINGNLVANGTALEMAGLQDRSLAALSGRSLSGLWRDTMQQVGADAASATSRAQSALIVSDALEAQRAAISGVSLDEESINLLESQRQYQAAARLISVAQEMTATLMELL